jgi:hypothetical protein
MTSWNILANLPFDWMLLSKPMTWSGLVRAGDGWPCNACSLAEIGILGRTCRQPVVCDLLYGGNQRRNSDPLPGTLPLCPLFRFIQLLNGLPPGSSGVDINSFRQFLRLGRFMFS